LEQTELVDGFQLMELMLPNVRNSELVQMLLELIISHVLPMEANVLLMEPNVLKKVLAQHISLSQLVILEVQMEFANSQQHQILAD
jgi:hypothetical protein